MSDDEHSEAERNNPTEVEPGTPDLGAFSVSLNVADLGASKAFYERIGFSEVGGDADQNWLMMANGTTIIGLFHGMFEANILTFNPGLTNGREQVPVADDVRSVQEVLEAAGVDLDARVDADNTEGPGHIVFRDPDGNVIMIDQFF